MSNRKITQLVENTNPALSDVFATVNNNVTKKLSFERFVGFLDNYFGGDVSITGGTYSDGTAVFVNNTGGTVSITGFSTGYTLTVSEITDTLGYVPLSAYTDTFITGGTIEDGSLKLNNNLDVELFISGGSLYNTGVILGASDWLQTFDGSIMLPNLKVGLYDNPDFIGPLITFEITGGKSGTGNIPDLVNLKTNYIVIDYNNGNPIYDVLIDDTTINDSNIVRYLTVFRAEDFLHILDYGNQGAGKADKINNRIVATNRFARESGFALDLSGDTGVVVLSEGVAWNAVNRQELDSVNSLDDIFFKNFHSGGTFVYTTNSNTINNSFYDNGNDIVNATIGKYLTNYYFRGQEINDHLYEVYSVNEYNSIAEAQLSTIPPLPELITSHAFLVGRIIIEVGSFSGAVVESSFITPFQASQVTRHNDLSNIQGGSANEYFHLSSGEYANNAYTNVDNNFSVNQTFISLSANTISGGTLYGDGSNLTNIADTYVTGVTYSDGVLTISQNENFGDINTNIGLKTKVGVVNGSSFTGNPKTTNIIFSSPFSSNNYGIFLTGEDNRVFTYSNKTVSGFTISANANQVFDGDVYWQAISLGETN
jgi:hypothetical protein